MGSSYPTHPVLNPIYTPAIMIKNMAATFTVVTMVCAKELCKWVFYQIQLESQSLKGEGNLKRKKKEMRKMMWKDIVQN